MTCRYLCLSLKYSYQKIIPLKWNYHLMEANPLQTNKLACFNNSV